MEARLLSAGSIPCIYKPSCGFAYPRWEKNSAKPRSLRTVHASSMLQGKKRVDESQMYTLDGIRNSLIRQEDSIICSLVERAQFCYNKETYDPNAFSMDRFDGSLIDYMVKETEKLHATTGPIYRQSSSGERLLINSSQLRQADVFRGVGSREMEGWLLKSLLPASSKNVHSSVAGAQHQEE